jgi:hypothetical protein
MDTWGTHQPQNPGQKLYLLNRRTRGHPSPHFRIRKKWKTDKARRVSAGAGTRAEVSYVLSVSVGISTRISDVF